MEHTMRNLLLITTTLSFACLELEEYEEGFAGEETETEYEDNFDEETVITVNWNSAGVTLELENSDQEGRYNWGLTENTGGCLDSEWGCWTGEDCHMGFDLTSGGNLSYCHPVGEGQNTISYGSTPDSVREGSSTVFGNAQFRTVVTHVLDDYSSFEGETCWTWGADTTYYNGFYKQCLEM
jgi:hypothetical protein